MLHRNGNRGGKGHPLIKGPLAGIPVFVALVFGAGGIFQLIPCRLDIPRSLVKTGGTQESAALQSFVCHRYLAPAIAAGLPDNTAPVHPLLPAGVLTSRQRRTKTAWSAGLRAQGGWLDRPVTVTSPGLLAASTAS
jgi:hypothetical protein